MSNSLKNISMRCWNFDMIPNIPFMWSTRATGARAVNSLIFFESSAFLRNWWFQNPGKSKNRTQKIKKYAENLGSIQKAGPFQPGIPPWNSRLEFQPGILRWKSNVEFRVGIKTRSYDLKTLKVINLSMFGKYHIIIII